RLPATTVLRPGVRLRAAAPLHPRAPRLLHAADEIARAEQPAREPVERAGRAIHEERRAAAQARGVDPPAALVDPSAAEHLLVRGLAEAEVEERDAAPRELVEDAPQQDDARPELEVARQEGRRPQPERPLLHVADEIGDRLAARLEQVAAEL